MEVFRSLPVDQVDVIFLASSWWMKGLEDILKVFSFKLVQSPVNLTINPCPREAKRGKGGVARRQSPSPMIKNYLYYQCLKSLAGREMYKPKVGCLKMVITEPEVR